jgi:hypothetical protein
VIQTKNVLCPGPAAPWKVEAKGGPHNSQTINVTVSLQKTGVAYLRIVNARGAQVAQVTMVEIPRGDHTIPFNIQALPSGMYWGRIEIAGISKNFRFIR